MLRRRLDEFSNNRPESRTHKTLWISFPEISLTHFPEIFPKNDNEVFPQLDQKFGIENSGPKIGPHVI